MLIAERNDAFLIDLRGDASLGDPVRGPDEATDVPATVEGIDGTVTFRVTQRAGRFRVIQVIVPGGSEELVPWSVRPLGA